MHTGKVEPSSEEAKAGCLGALHLLPAASWPHDLGKWAIHSTVPQFIYL